VLGIAPHSLRAVPRDHLAALLDLHRVGPVHIHIAEQLAEVREIEEQWGARPVEWLLENHEVNGRWCLVHATHMSDLETAGLAATGATAGLCPVTEADLGDGFFPARAFIDAGGVFGVGTDSNVAISLSEELRVLEYGQRLNTQQRNVLANASASTGRTLFEAILTGGARAAGRRSGAIAEGYLADMLTLDTNSLAFAELTPDAMLDAWIFSSDVRPTDVWCAGRHVVRERRHVARDAIEARYRRLLADLVVAG
jgi:formimidoylglutamate deiminase